MMTFIAYVALLLLGLLFLACFWPMVIAIIMLFSKDKKPKENNYPSIKRK